jgi:Na+/H+-dicarboxylate symporter
LKLISKLTCGILPASILKIIFRDRIRTAVNVMGDGVGCGFVEAMVERKNASKVAAIKDHSDSGLPSYDNIVG